MTAEISPAGEAPSLSVGALPKPAGAGSWRWLPVAVAGLNGLAILGFSLAPEWRAWCRGFLPMLPAEPFPDWEVLRRGWAASLAGEDPLGAAGAPFAHPRLVLEAAEFGLRIPSAVAGLLTAAAGLAGVVWMLWPRSRGQALLAAGIIASPPLLLLGAMGGLEAWAFALVAVGMTFLSRTPLRWPSLAGGGLALVAAMLLKLFPAVVFPAAALFWRGPRRVLSVAGFALWVAWFVTNLEDVVLILQKSSRMLESAYGRGVGVMRFYAEVIVPQPRGGGGTAALGLLLDASFLMGVAGFVVAAGLGWRWRERFAAAAAGVRDRALFWSGALIYGATFFMGQNRSDRLVFLVLCVPLLWRAVEAATVRRWGVAGLAGIALLFGSALSLPLGLFVVQQAVAWLLAWLLFALAVALLAADKDDGER